MKKLCELISKKLSGHQSKDCFFSKLWEKLTGKPCQTASTAEIPAPPVSSTENVELPVVESPVTEPVQQTAPIEPEESVVEVSTEPETVVAEIPVKSEPVVQTAVSSSCVKKSCLSIPEDATLRRHYLTHLKMMIMTVQGERPTDSALRRHYDALVEAVLDDCIHCSTMHGKLIANYEQNK